MLIWFLEAETPEISLPGNPLNDEPPLFCPLAGQKMGLCVMHTLRSCYF